jgi:hypothetical protein
MGQHVGAHVGKNDPLGAQVRQMPDLGLEIERELDLPVEELGFDDEQIGVVRSLPQLLGPFGVARMSIAIAFDSSGGARQPQAGQQLDQSRLGYQRRGSVRRHPFPPALIPFGPFLQFAMNGEQEDVDSTAAAPVVGKSFGVDERGNRLSRNFSDDPGLLECFLGGGVEWLEVFLRPPFGDYPTTGFPRCDQQDDQFAVADCIGESGVLPVSLRPLLLLFADGLHSRSLLPFDAYQAVNGDLQQKCHN